MPHTRLRHLAKIFKSFANHSPILGVFGHRQVGKTTFLEQKAQQYLTFDNESTLRDAQTDIEAFLEKNQGHLVGIDEAQLVPKLFPALKEVVRKNKKPGQYILSGSVRFYSRQSIRESLTGRIANMELIPLTLSEISHQDPIENILKLIKVDDITNLINPLIEIPFHERSDLIYKYFERGGLPGICFIRDLKKRKDQIHTQLKTILDRDLRLVYPSTLSFQQIYNFTEFIAQHEGQTLNLSQIKKELGLASVTQHKLIHALESIFLIRMLKQEGDSAGMIPVFEDQAESNFLAGNNNENRTPWIYLIYRNLREVIFYQSGVNGEFFQFKTRGGAKMPLALKIDNRVIGFDFCEDAEPSRAQLASCNSFLGRYNNSKVIFLTNGNKTAKKIKERIYQMPMESLLFY